MRHVARGWTQEMYRDKYTTPKSISRASRGDWRPRHSPLARGRGCSDLGHVVSPALLLVTCAWWSPGELGSMGQTSNHECTN